MIGSALCTALSSCVMTQSPISVTASLSKATVSTWEPLILTLEITNSDSVPRKVKHYTPTLTVLEEGSYKAVETPYWDLGEDDYVTVPAGSAVYREVVMSPHVCAEAGEYRCRAGVLHRDSTAVTSNVKAAELGFEVVSRQQNNAAMDAFWAAIPDRDGLRFETYRMLFAPSAAFGTWPLPGINAALGVSGITDDLRQMLLVMRALTRVRAGDHVAARQDVVAAKSISAPSSVCGSVEGRLEHLHRYCDMMLTEDRAGFDAALAMLEKYRALHPGFAVHPFDPDPLWRRNRLR